MAELLVRTENVPEDHVPGEVLTVQDDGHHWSDYERRLFVVIQCPEIDVAKASEMLRDGVPEEASQAVLVALATFRSLSSAERADLAEIDSARVALQDAIHEARPGRWPPRLRFVDLSAVPRVALSRVTATWQRRAEIRPAAKAEARARVVSVIEGKLGRKLNPEESQRTTIDFIRRLDSRIAERSVQGLDVSEHDALREDIIRQSRVGLESVEGPELAALPIPPTVAMTADELLAATKTVDAKAFHEAHP